MNRTGRPRVVVRKRKGRSLSRSWPGTPRTLSIASSEVKSIKKKKKKKERKKEKKNRWYFRKYFFSVSLFLFTFYVFFFLFHPDEFHVDNFLFLVKMGFKTLFRDKRKILLCPDRNSLENVKSKVFRSFLYVRERESR